VICATRKVAEEGEQFREKKKRPLLSLGFEGGKKKKKGVAYLILNAGAEGRATTRGGEKKGEKDFHKASPAVRGRKKKKKKILFQLQRIQVDLAGRGEGKGDERYRGVRSRFLQEKRKRSALFEGFAERTHLGKEAFLRAPCEKIRGI